MSVSTRLVPPPPPGHPLRRADYAPFVQVQNLRTRTVAIAPLVDLAVTGVVVERTDELDAAVGTGDRVSVFVDLGPRNGRICAFTTEAEVSARAPSRVPGIALLWTSRAPEFAHKLAGALAHVACAA